MILRRPSTISKRELGFKGLPTYNCRMKASVEYYWEHPNLTKHLKTAEAGTYLFRQGDKASTMMLLIRGIIELQTEENGKPQVVNLVEAGQFIGEKAILKKIDYPRAFSAQARNDLTFLEMSWSDIEALRAKDPHLVGDILRQMFRTAVERLDRSNYLIHILRSTDNVERLVHLIIFFARTQGRPGATGRELFLPDRTIHYYLDLSQGQLDDVFNELFTKNLLIRSNPDCLTVPNETKLLQYVPNLSRQFATGQFDELEAIP